MSAETLKCPMCGASASTDSTRCDHCGARLATVSCPSCFGMMFQGQKFCSQCGSRADRAEMEGQSVLLCPRCRKTTRGVSIGGTRLQECSKCDGVWVDATALSELCSDREKQAALLGMAVAMPESASGVLEKSIRYVPCPVCRKLMNRVNFARCSQVVVDVCKAHGTWFDRDELRRVVEFIRGGGLEEARARELSELQEQRRKARAEQVAGAWDSGARSLDFNADDRYEGIYALAKALKNLVKRD